MEGFDYDDLLTIARIENIKQHWWTFFIMRTPLFIIFVCVRFFFFYWRRVGLRGTWQEGSSTSDNVIKDHLNSHNIPQTKMTLFTYGKLNFIL